MTDAAVGNVLLMLSYLPCLHNLYLDRWYSRRRSRIDTDLSSNAVYSIVNYFIKHRPTSFLYISVRGMWRCV